MDSSAVSVAEAFEAAAMAALDPTSFDALASYVLSEPSPWIEYEHPSLCWWRKNNKIEPVTVELSRGPPGVYSQYHWSPQGHHIRLLNAAIINENECKNREHKVPMIELILLAGAEITVGDREHCGWSPWAPDGGRKYAGSVPLVLLNACTASSSARLASWPANKARIKATTDESACIALVRSLFCEVCCEKKIDEAGLASLLQVAKDEGDD
jgi:hypothetical protein